MRAVLAILIGLLAVGAAHAQVLYAPPEGDFTVAFPQPPSAQSRPANRSKDVAARRYVSQQPSRALVVAIDDYPDGMLPSTADAGVYEHMLLTRAEGDQGRLISTRAARLAGRPCLEGAIMGATGDMEIVRILMIGERVYQLTYALPEGADPAGADAAFFNSFKITKAP